MSQPSTTGSESVGRKYPPTTIAICLTFLVTVVVGSVTLLAFYEKDPSQIVQMLNLILSVGGLGTGATALVYSGAAAQHSQRAAVQTNGGMETRIQAAVTAALNEREQQQQ